MQTYHEHSMLATAVQQLEAVNTTLQSASNTSISVPLRL
jgi:hypothetical protein